MLESLLHYNFLRNALAGALLASVACGVIGTIIMEKKLVMMSGGIAHTAFGGVGFGYFLGIEPIIGALVFSSAAALGISFLKEKTKTNPDLLVGMFWAFGMAAGVFFISFTPGYPPDMNTYLFGDILTVSQTDLQLIAVLNAIIVFTVAAFYIPFTAYLFDEEFAVIAGIKTKLLEKLLFVMIAFTIVILIRIMGIILVLALFTAPASIAKLFSRSFPGTMALAALCGAFFSLFGLWLSYLLSVPSGASITICAVLFYLAVSLVKS